MYDQEVLDHPPFQLHIEPKTPIELPDLLRCLAAINHQFEVFVVREGLAPASDAKLLVSSVKPGSIDIGLLPDITTLGTMIAPVLVYSPPVLKFLTSLKSLIDKFRTKPDSSAVSVKDCSDVIAITKPIASSGGSQTFNSYTGDVYMPVFHISAADAKDILGIASEVKAEIEGEAVERHQRVPLIWHGLDKDDARSGGKRSPDKGIIEELDVKPKSVFFEDAFIGIKRTMVDDHINPYQKVFFVDVAVSRIAGKIVSYRIVGYHGEEDLDAE